MRFLPETQESAETHSSPKLQPSGGTLTAALILAVLTIALVACSGSSQPASTASALSDATVTAAAPASPTAAPDLALQIGVRASLPPEDPIDLATRYRTAPQPISRSKAFAGEANVGEERDFTVIRLTSDVFSHRAPPPVNTIRAALRAKSAHAYFYQDTSISGTTGDVESTASDFESSVWPAVTGTFGEPAVPGFDGDPRIIVLQTDLGGAALGYFVPDNAYSHAIRGLSNEAEMVYIDRTVRPGTAAFNVVLAHEFQHLVHAHNDPLEESWVNEGLSEDASGIVGGAVSSIEAFAADPATQLNLFDRQASAAHYGAGAAFFRYVASRFGGDASFGAIAHEQRHGTLGVDDFLASVGAPRFRDVFADWITANVLNLPAGPYSNPARRVDAKITDTLSPGDSRDESATQFGTDYYRLNGLGSGNYVLKFRGAPTVPVLPAQTPSGSAGMLWSNAEDGIDTLLTREVDLTNIPQPMLTFKTWFDIEQWFDWGYVAVSEDDGKTWEALAGEHTTTQDPARQAYGVGFTGASGAGEQPDWIDEKIDLAKFAGKKILLRFEYVTDPGTHGEGWAVSDINVAGTGSPDLNGSGNGWTSEGWVNVDQPLSQTYVVRLIEQHADGSTSIADLPLDVTDNGELRFNADGIDEATLAVAGTTEGTDQKAPYHIELATP